MRIFVSSDLHYGHSEDGDSSVRALAEWTACLDAKDVLILAGDIGTSDEAVSLCLERFRDCPAHKLAVAGNHDVWVQNGFSSWERLARQSTLYRAHGFHALEDGPVVIGGIGFAGTMGWYDYSFRDEIDAETEDYERKVCPWDPEVRWADADYVSWQFSDQEATEAFSQKLERHLRDLDHVERVFVAMHHLPFKEMLFHPRRLVPKQWRFLNAFMGSTSFGETIKRHPNVMQVACGHVHAHRSHWEDSMICTSNGGDYSSKSILRFTDHRWRRGLFSCRRRCF
jgi:predicted phosphohydrolase